MKITRSDFVELLDKAISGATSAMLKSPHAYTQSVLFKRIKKWKNLMHWISGGGNPSKKELERYFGKKAVWENDNESDI